MAMDSRELLRKVRRIEIKTRRLSNHLFSGEYHSSFKGRGMAFAEVRPYQYGDDIRHIHWNMTARHHSPYVKVFEEERELTLMLVVDISQSLEFATQGQWKREMAAEICATLAFSAQQNNDKVGLLLFSDRIERYIPPGKGRHQVLRIIRELLECTPEGTQTNLSAALETLGQIIRKRAIAFVISDFMDQGYDHALKLAARRHDLTGLRLTDPAEETLPRIGLTPLYHAETGALQWIDTLNPRVRKQYQNRYQNATRAFQKSFAESGAGQVHIRTTDDYAAKLLAYFQTR
jgi:uncharacterized protein (DUF58 family)